MVECRGRVRDDLDLDSLRTDDLLEIVGRDGADLAELLGDHDVRIDLRPRFLVDRVERLAVLSRSDDRAVDLGARQLGSVYE